MRIPESSLPLTMPRLTRRHVAAVTFTLLYLAVGAVYSFSTGNSEFVFYIVVLLVIMAAVGTVHWRVNLPVAALWALSAWGLSHVAGGTVPIRDGGVLYNLWFIPGWLKFDQVVHAYGFGLCAWICWLAVRGQLRSPAPRVGILLLCALGGMGLGAINEVVEFTVTRLVPETNVGGYENNSWDLVFNMLGCAVAVIAIALHSSRTTRGGTE